MINVFDIPISSLAYEAWCRGRVFDLDGIGYGLAHWTDACTVPLDRRPKIISQPYDYYYWLAGIVNITEASKILEIGTHQGGSALSMSKGLVNPSNSTIVTLDVTEYGVNDFRHHNHIRAHQVNANTENAFDICSKELDNKIDMLFIDSTHNFWTTYLNLIIYVNGLSPSIIVIDDITLNPEMQKMWDKTQMLFGMNNCTNVSNEIPGFRPHCGFGLVRNKVK